MYFSELHQSNELGRKSELKIKPFVKECIRICWMCLIQFPPMKVDFEPNARGKYFSTDVYKPYTKSGISIDYIVWPALLLHENGPVIAKGIAQGFADTAKQNRSQTAITEKHGGKRAGLFVANVSNLYGIRYKQMSKSENDLSTKAYYPNDKSLEKVNKLQASDQNVSPRRKVICQGNVRTAEAVQPVQKSNCFVDNPNIVSASHENLPKHYRADGYSKQRSDHVVIQERLSRADQKVKHTTTQQRKEKESRSRAKSADARQRVSKRETRRSLTPTHIITPQLPSRSPSHSEIGKFLGYVERYGEDGTKAIMGNNLFLQCQKYAKENYGYKAEPP